MEKMQLYLVRYNCILNVKLYINLIDFKEKKSLCKTIFLYFTKYLHNTNV